MPSSPWLNSALIIVTALVGNTLCAENTRDPNNPWRVGNTNNQNIPLQPSNGPATPWPSLAERKNQLQSAIQQQSQQNNYQSNVNRQSIWVRPDNSFTWERNTPRPNQGVVVTEKTGNGANNRANVQRISPGGKNAGAANTNSNFINNEKGARGGALGPANQNRGTLIGDNNPTDQRQDLETGSVSDNELRELAEELLKKDSNNAAKYVNINFQGMTSSRSSRDEAPQPLLSIDQEAYSLPTVSRLVKFYDNYILEAKQNEVYTAQEKIEENELLDAILPTSVMEHARNFLIKKGKIGKDPREFKDILRTIWFNMYSRGQGRIGSSGFEHIFLAELKNSQVSGLHNWIYFNEEEKKNNANYLGYMKKIDLGNKGAILKYHFTFQGIDKPVGSMFIGTSPELEMALYSTCFILRADRICPLQMNGNRFIIRTYTYRYRGKSMIGSAFPEI